MDHAMEQGAYRDRVGLVNLELSRFVLIGVHAGREEVEEATQEVKVLPCHVGHLEDGADPREGREKRCTSIYIVHVHT